MKVHWPLYISMTSACVKLKWLPWSKCSDVQNIGLSLYTHFENTKIYTNMGRPQWAWLAKAPSRFKVGCADFDICILTLNWSILTPCTILPQDCFLFLSWGKNKNVKMGMRLYSEFEALIFDTLIWHKMAILTNVGDSIDTKLQVMDSFTSKRYISTPPKSTKLQIKLYNTN